MALVKLGNKAVGSTVKLKENGTPVDYIVVHQGRPSSIYDASCDGVWLLRKEIAENRVWRSDNVNKWEISEINTYLNGTWMNRYEVNIKAAIKQVKIPYRKNGGSGGITKNGSDGLSCNIFLLSAPEVNYTGAYIDDREGTALEYFKDCYTSDADTKRVAYLNGSVARWWLRTPRNNTPRDVCGIFQDGSGIDGWGANCSFGVRPAMILPPSLWVSDDGSVTTNTAPAAPAGITVPGQINGGSTITVSWGASSDAEGNLEGYKVERSVDGGSAWAQVYQGGARSTANTVPFGTQSVMYRVRAYDTEGLESGWKTSGQVAVINNTAPTVPGRIDVPEQVQGGQPLAIAWGASSDGENNLAGYSLERQVDGGDWAAVYSGDQLSFTDQITKGWQTVAYRVRAYDDASAYSGFTASETRQVNNNTPPAISCEYAQNTSLGVKNEGFELSYSVSDEEGDAVAVTELVDGAALRTFDAVLGEENSFRLDGTDFMKLLNGPHTLSISAGDGTATAVHKLSFSKLVTEASVTLAQPMEADGAITVCVLAVSGFIPADARLSVEVTNNALDSAPVWENCTAEVKAGANYVFENGAAANGFAFNFRLWVERGESGVGGYITSVQGGFQ